MSKHLARRRVSIKTMVIPIAVLAVVILGVAGASSANLSGSTFEGNDGNLTVNTAGNADWVNAPNRVRGDDLASGTSDNSFGQGTKEDDPNVSVVTGSIPPQKSDLTRFYVGSEFANSSNYLYLAWERSNVLGSANMDFEINKLAQPNLTTTGPKTLNRSAGDLLITFDFGGSGSPVLGLLKWVTSGATSQCFSANALPCWGNRVNLSAAGEAEGAVNSVTVNDPIANVSLPAGTFGEAAVNLTAAGVFPTGTCTAFGSTFLKSRSSASFPAEVKDFVAPQPVNISNCGTIVVNKVTENGNATFGYTTTGGLSPSTFTLQGGDTRTYGPGTVLPGTYTVTEDTPLPSGWTFKTLTCTTGGAVNGQVATITMTPGATITCTYTNHTNVTPSITTLLSASTVNIGDPVHDSATLTGATSDAGGTVTYSAYAGANNCTGTDLLNSTVTVTNGVVPDSAAFTPTAAGTYSFQAVYSGDANNNGASSVCSTEQLLVKASPLITTLLSASTVNIGDPVHDSATLTGATSDAGGTVTYSAYAGANTCTGTDLLNSTKTVTNGIVPDSDAFIPTAAGTYSFQAVYSGDANNNGASSVCSTEQLLVKAGPSITTTLSATSVDVGSTVHDSATLTGATSDAGGTVTYTVYTNDTCTAGARDAGTKTVTNGVVPDSDPLAFNTAGTFYWQAVYSGDANNNGATSTCTDETLVVNKKQPSASTAQNLIPNDNFTLSGGFNPTGTITFNLYDPSDATCAGTPALTQTVNVSGNGTYSTTNTTFIASTEGTWRWQSSYSGDGNNQPVASSCGTERFTIANN
jgi:hypothetical protein